MKGRGRIFPSLQVQKRVEGSINYGQKRGRPGNRSRGKESSSVLLALKTKTDEDQEPGDARKAAPGWEKTEKKIIS